MAFAVPLFRYLRTRIKFFGTFPIRVSVGEKRSKMKDIKSLDVIRQFFKEKKKRAKAAKRLREKRQRKLKQKKKRMQKEME